MANFNAVALSVNKHYQILPEPIGINGGDSKIAVKIKDYFSSYVKYAARSRKFLVSLRSTENFRDRAAYLTYEEK